MAGVAVVDAVGRLGEGASACFGAVFLTYTFDATFFEEELLATLLPLHEDPAEAARRFLEEGRRALMETPVVVIADSGMLRGGQRLPYDLLRADASRTFHPKLALILHASGARLLVGSGNLTSGGHGGNAELCATLQLDYKSDAGLIRRVVAFVGQCGARGEAWGRFLAELEPRLGPASAGGTEPPWLLHTLEAPVLLDAFLARLPPQASVERIGVLAPFHQEDGAPPDGAVFDRLLDATEARRSRGFVLDVGVSWEGNPVAPGPDPSVGLDAHVGELWGMRSGARGKETTAWFVLGKHEGHCFRVDDGRTPGWRSTRELNALCGGAPPGAWTTGKVQAFAPEGLVDRAGKRAKLRLWLYPEVQRRDGRVFRQPLHGKLLAVAVTDGGVKRTHLLLGSPNASAAAFLNASGNVECALHLVVEGHHHLGTLCDRLVLVPREQVELRGRTFTPPALSPARWVVDAIYDARVRLASVSWLDGAPHLVLCYPTAVSRLLMDGVPNATTCHGDFDLDPACCELEVCDPASGIVARVPLRVEHVLSLPVEGLSGDLNLAELLLLHAGKYTPAAIAARRAASGGADELTAGTVAIFGAMLTPREVFRALLSIGAELGKSTSLGAFQALLLGPWGVRRLAERIVDAPTHGELMRGEAWIYGLELAKVLAQVTFDGDPTGREKGELRDEAVRWIRTHLAEPEVGTPGLAELRQFYGGGE